jgi:hypothetical protein
MPSINSWKEVQACSGLAIGIFLAMHLMSHYSLIISFERANANLLKFRAIYQHPVFEIGLFLALVLHMASNVQIYCHRQKVKAVPHKNEGKTDAKTKAGALELKGHRYAGYFLAISMVGHIGSTRIAPRFVLDKPADYDYGFLNAVNDIVPYNLFAIYLSFLGMAGGWHLIYGTLSAVTHLRGSSLLGKPFPFVAKPVAMLNHVLIINAMLALIG